MNRAQILLEDWQLHRLHRLAAMEKKSLSQIIREWVSEKLNEKTGKKKDPLVEAAGMFREEIKESVDHKELDSIIYK